MAEIPLHQIFLGPHPTTPSDIVERLDVQLSLPGAGVANLVYTLRGDLSRLRIGEQTQPGQADGLWKHTCFEAFIRPRGSEGYYEFNFAPTRQWAVYRFSGYRAGMTSMDLARPPDISVQRTDGALELRVLFPLPFTMDSGAVRHASLAVAAVVEEDGGRLTYWAGRHAAGKPDFHHTDGFAFEL